MQARNGLCAALAGALCLILSSVANAATGTIDHDGQPLTLADAPTTLANSNVTIADGNQVSIVCQSEGQTLSGDFGASSLWDLINVGGVLRYAPDAFVNTGTNGFVAPICGSASGTSAFGVVRASAGLRVHTQPSTSSPVVTTVPNDTVVEIGCQTNGSNVNGDTLWDSIPNGFVTDFFVLTGADGRIAGSC